MKSIIAIMLSIILLGCLQQQATEITKQEKQGITATGMQKETKRTEISYVPFEKASYEKARASGKAIFLEFYASWCPTCAQQEPEIETAFKELENENAIQGFRVNYNDNDTDEDEKQLAREFGIAYQHTHVLIDSKGNVVKKELNFWDKQKVLEELKALK